MGDKQSSGPVETHFGEVQTWKSHEALDLRQKRILCSMLSHQTRKHNRNLSAYLWIPRACKRKVFPISGILHWKEPPYWCSSAWMFVLRFPWQMPIFPRLLYFTFNYQSYPRPRRRRPYMSVQNYQKLLFYAAQSSKQPLMWISFSILTLKVLRVN